MEKRKLSSYSCSHCGKSGLEEDMVYELMFLEKTFCVDLIITSAFRCDVHNVVVGGSQKSKHLEGKAIDFTHPDKEVLDEIAEHLDHYWKGGFKYYRARKFIHFDSGSERRW